MPKKGLVPFPSERVPKENEHKHTAPGTACKLFCHQHAVNNDENGNRFKDGRRGYADHPMDQKAHDAADDSAPIVFGKYKTKQCGT